MLTKPFPNFIIILFIFISGCTSTKGSWYPFSSGDLSAKKSQRVTSSKQQSALAVAETEKIKEQLNTLMLEWNAVKFDVNRLIELEAELSYIVDEMGQNEIRGNLSNPDAYLEQYTKDSMPELYSSNSILNDANTTTTEKLSKFDNKITVGKASPIISSRNRDNAATKFSHTNDVSTARNEQISRDDQNTIVQDIKKSAESKFSQLNNTMLDSNCAQLTPENAIGIHLISLKDKSKVEDAAAKLLKQFSEYLCGSYRVSTVTVNQEHYYSIRFGPYIDKQKAKKVCTLIRAKGQYCGLADYDGEMM